MTADGAGARVSTWRRPARERGGFRYIYIPPTVFTFDPFYASWCQMSSIRQMFFFTFLFFWEIFPTFLFPPKRLDAAGKGGPVQAAGQPQRKGKGPSPTGHSCTTRCTLWSS